MTNLLPIKQRYGIIGNSEVLNNALSTAVRVAPTDLTVLITGESGVGKEIFSQIIHNLSPRKHNQFIAVNCGAIPEGTIDSELFGHEKGAFTGAHDARKGYFEFVNGGTIFLDEIGEMPLGTQARLLRVLETGEFMRVGSSKVIKTDVRVIAATNVNLQNFIRKHKFREDLYYRLNTVPITVPSLRERKEDIYLLFRKFCVDFADKNKTTPIQLDESAKEVLLKYHWPGNVRELKNIAEQASVLSLNKLLSADELMKFIPVSKSTLLPVIMERENEQGSFSDRELMYKLLFDMRKDITDIKQFLVQVMEERGDTNFDNIKNTYPQQVYAPSNYNDSQKPIIIESKEEFNKEEMVDEPVSLSDQEKELILKSLKRHKGKRRDAAAELGISERTLYRKIKEYNINE